MRIATMLKVLNTMHALDNLHQAVGEWGLAEITRWSGSSRATVNRVMPVLVELKLVEEKWIPYRGASARRWSLLPERRGVVEELLGGDGYV